MAACGHARGRRLEFRLLRAYSFSAGARAAGGERGLRSSRGRAGRARASCARVRPMYLTLHYVVPWIALSTLMSQTHTHSMPSKAWPRPRRRRPEREWTSEGNRAPRRVECMPNAWLQATSP